MIRKLAVVTLSLALTGGVLARAADPPPPARFAITCASNRGVRDFEDGLKLFHQGRLKEAVREFQSCEKRDPNCAMAAWGVSRAYLALGQRVDSEAAAVRAEALKASADDREQQLIAAWSRYLKALEKPAAEREPLIGAIRTDIDRILAIYPREAEIWLFRGEIAGSHLRSVPYMLTAFRLAPDHPLASSWKASVPPIPLRTAAPTQPVRPLPEPATWFDGLGNLTHPTSSKNAEAQRFYEQGLRCLHSYVTPYRSKNGAAQSFQHAAALDPTFAMAYWGLSFTPTNAMKPLDAANRAVELAQQYGNDKEQRFCVARLLELEVQDLREQAQRKRGEANRATGPDRDRLNGEANVLDGTARDKRELMYDVVDGAIAGYPDDLELWTWRGKIGGVYGTAPGQPFPAIPYQIAAWFAGPKHPSPNHELVHLYEAFERPALGWPYTVGYRTSAPNMPHANHMQAHLAMRLGRWEEALDCTRTSRKKGLEGYPELDPSHHIDTMIKALAHEGRFSEASAEARAYKDGLPWARLLQLKGDPAELAEWAARRLASNSPDGQYMSAVVKLNEGDLASARPFIDRVEQQYRSSPANFYRYAEVQGRFLVQSGKPDEGLKLLQEAAAKAVKDVGLHAWGGGSYVLEVWGEAALRAGRWDDAEEAYHEALAHEHGSLLGALGMQVVWERRGRRDMAEHYAARAAAIWKGADAGALERQRLRLRALAASGTAGGIQ